MYEDRMLSCARCNEQFVFSASEQEFFAQKGLTNLPKRCHNCRLIARLERDGRDASSTTEAACADCGIKTRVPFQPKGYKPIYCNSCMHTRRHAVDELPLAAS